MDIQEWYQIRKKSIGGSDIAAILGIDHFRTPLDVFLNKTGRQETQDNKYMWAGRFLEPTIADMFAEKTGYMVYNPKKRIYHHSTNPLFSASIDRFYRNGQECILECKSTQLQTDNPQEAHFVQLQWYLGVLDMNHGAIAYLERGVDFNYYEYERDDKLIDFLKSQAINFWNNHIVPDIPPSPTIADDVMKLYSKHIDGKAYEVSEVEYEKYLKLKEINEKRKALEKEEEEIEEEFKLKMLDSELAAYNGQTLITWKSSISNRFDTTGFKKLHPELYNQFTKQTESRRFLLK